MLTRILLVAVVFLQTKGLPPGDKVLENAEKAFEAVQDYSVNVEADVALEGLRIPKALIKMYFKKPDKVHFESASFAMLPREGMTLDPADLRRKYDAQTIGKVDTNDRVLYKLQLAARSPDTRLRQLYLWVDRDTWTIRRMESSPYSGRVLAMTFDYEPVNGTYLMISKLVATFGTVGPTTEPLFKVPEGAPNPAPQVEEMQRSLRSGSVTFRYSDYRINTGLPDSLFTGSGKTATANER